MWEFRNAQELGFIGVNSFIANGILIIGFLALITFIDYLIVSCEKGGMTMVSMTKVSMDFAISYVAGVIPAVFS